MKIRYTTLLLFILLTSAASSQGNLQDIINSVNTEIMLQNIYQLSGYVTVNFDTLRTKIVTRHLDKAGNEYARTLIQQKLAGYGLTSYLQPFNTEGNNILCEMTGTVFPHQKFIICAHYDDEPNTAIAPGADDNASGIAAVLEAARILSSYSFPYTIVFAFWDEEEHGILGSKFYAQGARAAGDSIRGVINFDMIGYDSNNDFVGGVHAKDTAQSKAIALKILEINNSYNIGMNFLYYPSGARASDHEAFWQQGYSAVWVNEDRDHDKNPYYHTARDSVIYINEEFLTRIAKVSIASLADLAKGNILPVELVSFTALKVNDKIVLKWTTTTEINNTGFQIERSFDCKNWSTVAFVSGAGNSNINLNYSFTDEIVKFNCIITYRLKQIDTDGSYKYSGNTQINTGILNNGYSLDQNYPNPFNPKTNIRFSFDDEVIARLEVYDVLGNKTAELFNSYTEPGKLYNIQFDASGYSSGVYYYKLTGENKPAVIKKMILLR